MLTPHIIYELCEKFHSDHGMIPTHILCTNKQQKEFSKEMSVCMRLMDRDNSRIITYHVPEFGYVDLLPIVEGKMGRSHEIQLPMALYIEQTEQDGVNEKS